MIKSWIKLLLIFSFSNLTVVLSSHGSTWQMGTVVPTIPGTQTVVSSSVPLAKSGLVQYSQIYPPLVYQPPVQQQSNSMNSALPWVMLGMGALALFASAGSSGGNSSGSGNSSYSNNEDDVPRGLRRMNYRNDFRLDTSAKRNVASFGSRNDVGGLNPARANDFPQGKRPKYQMVNQVSAFVGAR